MLPQLKSCCSKAHHLNWQSYQWLIIHIVQQACRLWYAVNHLDRNENSTYHCGELAWYSSQCNLIRGGGGGVNGSKQLQCNKHHLGLTYTGYYSLKMAFRIGSRKCDWCIDNNLTSMSKSTSPGSLTRFGSEQGFALGSFLGRPEGRVLTQSCYSSKVALKPYC